jgi:uncharacterized protein (DUF58 family)
MRQRLRQWALRRQGVDKLPTTLAARRIYILPTGHGWLFAALILVTFIAGMNYGNGLALLLAFWLAGFAIVAMIQTQRTLAGATLRSAIAQPAFAGSAVALSLHASAVTDLQLTNADNTASSAEHTDPGSDELRLLLMARQRGHWHAPVLRLESRAPFGLFRTWTWLQLDVRTIVYPRPVGERQIPESCGEDGGALQNTNEQDELAWLRDFREGDSPRQVAWKAYARGAPLLVREYRGYAAAARDFDYATLNPLPPEERLSQLCRWVCDAAQRNEGWTLHLPGQPPLAGSGSAHRDLCLTRLALFELHPGRRP